MGSDLLSITQLEGESRMGVQVAWSPPQSMRKGETGDTPIIAHRANRDLSPQFAKEEPKAQRGEDHLAELTGGR